MPGPVKNTHPPLLSWRSAHVEIRKAAVGCISGHPGIGPEIGIRFGSRAIVIGRGTRAGPHGVESSQNATQEKRRAKGHELEETTLADPPQSRIPTLCIDGFNYYLLSIYTIITTI